MKKARKSLYGVIVNCVKTVCTLGITGWVAVYKAIIVIYCCRIIGIIFTKLLEMFKTTTHRKIIIMKQ